jgi:hypothetical protein
MTAAEFQVGDVVAVEPPAADAKHGVIAAYWRGPTGMQMDWIRTTDIASEVGRVEILRHATEALIEYAAMKRQRLMDPPVEIPRDDEDLTVEKGLAIEQAIIAAHRRLKEEHEPWIAANVVLVALPESMSQDEYQRALQAFNSLMLSLPYP